MLGKFLFKARDQLAHLNQEVPKVLLNKLLMFFLKFCLKFASVFPKNGPRKLISESFTITFSQVLVGRL